MFACCSARVRKAAPLRTADRLGNCPLMGEDTEVSGACHGRYCVGVGCHPLQFSIKAMKNMARGARRGHRETTGQRYKGTRVQFDGSSGQHVVRFVRQMVASI